MRDAVGSQHLLKDIAKLPLKKKVFFEKTLQSSRSGSLDALGALVLSHF